MAVAHDEPVLAVEQGEALRDALDRVDQALLARAAGRLRPPQRRDVVEPGDAGRAGEADPVAPTRQLGVGDERGDRLPVAGPVAHLLIADLDPRVSARCR